MSGWRPPLLTTERKRRPNEGDVIGYDYRAWRVEHVSDADATAEELAWANKFKPEYRAERMPYRLTLRRIHGPEHEHENSRQEIAYAISGQGWHWWEVYREGRVPLCSCCHHPWPCLLTTAAEDSQRQGEILDGKMARAQPGLCYSCGEVISQRQQSVVYPEPNIELPGFPPPAFHLRNSCADGQREYDHKRAKAYPDAPPVLQDEQTGRML